MTTFNLFVTCHMCINPMRCFWQFAPFLCVTTHRIMCHQINNHVLSFNFLFIVKWVEQVGFLSWKCCVDLGLDKQKRGFRPLCSQVVDELQDCVCWMSMWCLEWWWLCLQLFLSNESPQKKTWATTSVLCVPHRCSHLIILFTTVSTLGWTICAWMSCIFPKLQLFGIMTTRVWLHVQQRVPSGQDIPKCVPQELVKNQQLQLKEQEERSQTCLGCMLRRLILARDNVTWNQTRDKTLFFPCKKCPINVCIPCVGVFHKVEDSVSSKKELKSTLLQQMTAWMSLPLVISIVICMMMSRIVQPDTSCGCQSGS